MSDFDERWLQPGGVVLVDPVTTSALLREIQRLRNLTERKADTAARSVVAARAAHTPGPWSIGELALGPLAVFAGKYSLATIRSDEVITNGVANASLIAAAPALLAACENAKKFLMPNLVEPGRTVFWELVSAIKKARGE